MGSDGRLAARRLYRVSDNTSLSSLAYGHDADGNITAIADQTTPANSAPYGHDGTGRLTQLLASGGTNGTTNYSYTSGTNRLAAVSDASGARSIAYDARGNTASESRPEN